MTNNQDNGKSVHLILEAFARARNGEHVVYAFPDKKIHILSEDRKTHAIALLEALEGEKYTKENEYFDMWSEHQGGYNQALDKAKQIISEYFGV